MDQNKLIKELLGSTHENSVAIRNLDDELRARMDVIEKKITTIQLNDVDLPESAMDSATNNEVVCTPGQMDLEKKLEDTIEIERDITILRISVDHLERDIKLLQNRIATLARQA